MEDELNNDQEVTNTEKNVGFFEGEVKDPYPQNESNFLNSILESQKDVIERSNFDKELNKYRLARKSSLGLLLPMTTLDSNELNEDLIDELDEKVKVDSPKT